MTSMLLISSLSGVSSLNWMSVWFMMETNTLAMCIIMTKDFNKNKIKKTSMMTYFLVQMMASSFIIILATSQMEFSMKEMMLVMMLMMKMGVWPFHLWYMSILSFMKLSNNSTVLVMTWQKVMPATMVSTLEISDSTKMMTMMLCILSMMLPILKMKTLNNNMTMSLSSLNNNSWIILSALTSIKMLIMLLLFYSLTMAMTMKHLSMNNMCIKKSTSSMMSYLMLFANLSGMPPFSMFWMKVMVTHSMMTKYMNMNTMVAMVVVSCAMVSLYLSMMMPMFMKTNKKTQNASMNKNSPSHKTKTITVLTILSSLLLMS